MKLLKKILWLVPAMGLTLTAWAQHGQGHGHDHDHAALNQAAPDFTLTDYEGKEHSLSDFEGKIVVLEWINPDCPFSKPKHEKEIVHKILKEWEGKPVQWIGIDSTHFHSADDVKEYAGKVELPYPVLLDPKGEVGHIYGARTTPHMYVIDKEGKLVYMGAFDDDPKNTSDEPTQYVVDAVNALLNGSTIEKQMVKPYGCTVKYKQ
jgi:peroxiredoxin